MEILLIACMLAYAAGAQSEQSKLGLSPAQRDIMRETARHEKAVRRIAEKHGDATVPATAGKPVAVAAPAPTTSAAVSGTFGSGYRSRRPASPPLSHRAGAGAATGVTWVQEAGRGAWRSYRQRRKAEGHPDPGPVLVPMPPDRPPQVPPMPSSPPTAGESGTAAPDPVQAAEPVPVPITSEPAAPDTTAPAIPPTKTTEADTTQGVGRMAAEVTYESVMDESDELSIMCGADVQAYDRIHERAEREVGRGDALIAQMEATGFGPKVIGWVTRCKEHYAVILSEVDDLKQNTVDQGEAVVKAKHHLEMGQGLYAGIAQDMEDVAEREAYISDAVDAEDTSADTEVYETKAVA
ncbi:hypothetical protein [Streptomyces candidus]|uniref:Uncharacterized protein n=1 Tax=Streptomyces candidus TaxID=67283 RepID=A0A7X0HLW1_9ACTN|nr:hypothetical protein [Streptomyces candidus]MBB6440102.1 hypothetical protein [Streptomyces candidus]GHH58029.1 hypothetical protein GCM10018773_66000 [Streptomyces candidus]